MMMGGEGLTVKVGGNVDLAITDNNTFHMAGATLQLVCEVVDFNGNDTVDLLDFASIQNDFTGD